MPHLKSLWPDLAPPPEILNTFEAIIGQPFQSAWPDFIAHVDEDSGKSWTFREVKKRVNDLATTLGSPLADGGLGLNTENGDLVAIVADNSSDYIVLLLALLKIGIPSALINLRLTPAEISHDVKTAKPATIFTIPERLSEVLAITAESNIAPASIFTLNGSSHGHESIEGLIHTARSIKNPIHEARKVSKDALAFVIFSSSTTGPKKVVKLSHGNVFYALQQLTTLFSSRKTATQPSTPSTLSISVELAQRPLYFAFGLHTFCTRGFLVPTQVIFSREWDTAKVLRAIPRYQVTKLSMVPWEWQQLASHPNFETTDLGSLTTITSSASHLPRELASKILERTPNTTYFSEGYGITEATALALVRPRPKPLDGHFEDVLSSTGVFKLLPGMEARIVHGDGTEADFGEVGELWLKGSNIVSGYLDNPQATQENFVNGWHRTGDYFKVDQEHHFFFVDRIKDIIRTPNGQVSPTEIEQALMAHPQGLLFDVAVAGVTSRQVFNERVPRAWIVLSENGRKLGAASVIRELEKWCHANLNELQWLRGGIEVVHEIPRTSGGKTLRRVLQDQYEHRLTVVNAKTAKSTLIIALVIAIALGFLMFY